MASTNAIVAGSPIRRDVVVLWAALVMTTGPVVGRDAAEVGAGCGSMAALLLVAATGGAATVCDGGLDVAAGLDAGAVVVPVPVSPAPPTGSTIAAVVAVCPAGDAARVADAFGVGLGVGEAFFFVTTAFLLALTLTALGVGLGSTTARVVAGAAVVTGAVVVGTAVVTAAVLEGAGEQLGDGVGLGVEESVGVGVVEGVSVGTGGSEIVGSPGTDGIPGIVMWAEIETDGVPDVDGVADGDAHPGSS